MIKNNTIPKQKVIKESIICKFCLTYPPASIESIGFDLIPNIELYILANSPESKKTEIIEIIILQYHFKCAIFEIVIVKKAIDNNGNTVNSNLPVIEFSIIAFEFFVL